MIKYIHTVKEKLSEKFHLLKTKVYKSNFGPKVFCIGYNKTGTTTVGKSLEILGFRNSSFNKTVWRKYYKTGDLEKIIKYTSRFESFDDLPWLKEDIIPIMDKKFPNSKFIYLERDETSWKSSFKNWNIKVTGKAPNVEVGWEKYLKHRLFVFSYFKGREDDLLVLQVNDPNGFKKLGEFLGRKSPQLNFPHFNKT